jgi:single-stranded DNA-binding protein
MNQVTMVGRLTRDPKLQFGKHAASCAEHLSKGRQVAVNGRLIFREWTGKDGVKRSAHSIRGAVEFLGPRLNGNGNGGAGAEELPIAY